MQYEDKLNKTINPRELAKSPDYSGKSHPRHLKVSRSSDSRNVDRISGALYVLKDHSYHHTKGKKLTGEKHEPLYQSERLKYLKKATEQASSPHLSDYIPQSECPKTVVVDPLHYLERCEKQGTSCKESKATPYSNRIRDHEAIRQSIFTSQHRSDRGHKEESKVKNAAPVPNPLQCYEVKSEHDKENIRRNVRQRKRGRDYETNIISAFSDNSQCSTIMGHSSCLPLHCQAMQYSSPSGYLSSLPSQQYIPQGELINPCTDSITRHDFDKGMCMLSPTVGIAKPLLQLDDDALLTSAKNHASYEPEDSLVLHEMQPLKCTATRGCSRTRKPLVVHNAQESSSCHIIPVVHDGRQAPRVTFHSGRENKSGQLTLYDRQPSYRQPWLQCHEGQVHHPLDHYQMRSEPCFASVSDRSIRQQHHHYPGRHYHHQHPQHMSSLYSYWPAGVNEGRVDWVENNMETSAFSMPSANPQCDSVLGFHG